MATGTTEAPVPVGTARAGIVFGTVLAVLVQAIDSTIAAVALPHMQGSLSASQDEINWVITSYIVAVAIMTTPAGWLANRYGRRRVLLVSVGGFTAASVLTGLAQTLDQMVLFRLLQGAFGAPLVPLAQSLLLDTFGPRESLRATAWWSIGGVLGPIIGPNIGGWITENWDWRWVFFINVPIGLVCLACLAFFVPETGKRKIDFDWFGFSALSIFIACFQLVMDRGTELDWFDSTEIITEAAVAVLAFYCFVVHTMTTPRALIDFSTLRDRNFASGNVFSFIFSMLFMTLMVLIPTFLQNVVDDPVGLAGSLMAPRSMGAGIVMVIFGRFRPRLDPRLTAFMGLILVTYELFRMSEWNQNVSSFDVVSTGFLQGFGTALASVSMQGMSFTGISPQQRDGAVTVYGLTRNFGQSMGVSVVTALLVRNIQVNHADLSAHATPFNRALQSGAPQHFWNLHHTATVAALDGEIGRQAAVIAYSDDFRLLMVLAVLVIPFVFFFRLPQYMKR